MLSATGFCTWPFMVILYINDICNVSKVFDCILFDDDTKFFCSDNDINDLCGIINVELDKLSTWFSVNELSLNIQKNTLYSIWKQNY